MNELTNAHVLISGMRGVGIEIAKNIILCGVKSVLICDCENIDSFDLSLKVNTIEDLIFLLI